MVNPNENWAINSILAIAIVLVLSNSGDLRGNPATPLTVQEDESTDKDLAQTRRQYDQAVLDWKEASKEAILARWEFETCLEKDAEYWRQNWFQAVQKGRDQFEIVTQTGIELVKRGAADEDEDIKKILYNILELRFDAGDYHGASELGSVLAQRFKDDAKGLLDMAKISKSLNQFEEAKKHLSGFIALGSGQIPPFIRIMNEQLDAQISAWKHENAIRELEAKADDLPRVELVLRYRGTEQGKVIIELFENEAPGAVANFINLVESGFYNNVPFYRVITHTAAHTGCPNGDGSGDAGYTIETEYHVENARKNFRGSVGMLNAGIKNTASSQFYIGLVPLTHLDTTVTVFGRVIDGMEHVDRLVRTHIQGEEGYERLETTDPDRILSARVIRKRNHEYVPKKANPNPE